MLTLWSLHEFYLILLVDWFLPKNPDLPKIKAVGKIQVFLPGEPIYSKICFLGKAEMEQLNFPVSWRNAMMGSWLWATWNEEWWISFLEDWLDSCLDHWGKRCKFLFGSIMVKKSHFHGSLLNFVVFLEFLTRLVFAPMKMQSKQKLTALLMLFFSETERFLLCHLRSGLRDTAREGWMESSFFLLSLFILISAVPHLLQTWK